MTPFDPRDLVEAARLAGGREWEVYSEPEVGMPPTLMELGERDGWFTRRTPVEPLDGWRLNHAAASNPSAILSWAARDAAQVREIAELRAALEHIRDAHLPDQPMAFGAHPEAGAEHRDRHIMNLRRRALAALAGARGDG